MPFIPSISRFCRRGTKKTIKISGMLPGRDCYWFWRVLIVNHFGNFIKLNITHSTMWNNNEAENTKNNKLEIASKWVFRWKSACLISFALLYRWAISSSTSTILIHCFVLVFLVKYHKYPATQLVAFDGILLKALVRMVVRSERTQIFQRYFRTLARSPRWKRV